MSMQFAVVLLLAGCESKIELPYQKQTQVKTTENPAATPALTLLVEPQYPNALDWSTYVRRSDLTTKCDGTETGMSPCLHGGDKKKIVITGVSSCSGLSMTDSLGVFNWYCRVTSGTATFYSTLKLEKGLMDLVSSSGWKHPVVTLHGGIHSGAQTSMLVNWWGNEVVELPENGATCTAVPGYVTCEASGRAVLTKDNAVYVMSTNRANTETLGYKIIGNGIAFTTLPGVVIHSVPNLNCTNDNSETTGPYTYNCTLTTYAKLLWVEGKFDFTVETDSFGSYTFPLFVRNTSLSTFRNIQIAHSNDDAVYIDGSASNSFSYIKMTNSGLGIWQDDAGNNPTVTANNTFAQIFAANLTYTGFYSAIADDSVITTTTLANNDFGTLFNYNTDNSVFHNFLVMNSRTQAFYVDDSTGNTYGQIASFYSNYGLNLERNPGSKVTGNLVFGNNSSGDCLINGTSPILSNCLNDAVNSSALSPSDAVVTTGVDVAAAFRGDLYVEVFTTVADWYAMDWFLDDYFKLLTPTANFLDPATAGVCGSSRTHCAYHDFALLESDTIIRNTTDDGHSQNAAFSSGSPCPSAIDGNKVVVDASGTKTFMKNAIEIDGAGNGNGLCESGETCLYTPNFGAYQGHGEFGTCTFSNGTISNVVMFGYEKNGY